MKTPTATPMVTSATRRSRWPYDVPRLTTAATGAKNGVGWSKQRRVAMNQATPAASDALPDVPALGPQPGQPRPPGDAAPRTTTWSHAARRRSPPHRLRIARSLHAAPPRDRIDARRKGTPCDRTDGRRRPRAFMIAESRNTPMHVGGLQLFELPEGAGPGLGPRDLTAARCEVEDIAPLYLKRPTRSLAHGRRVGLEAGRGVRPRVPRPAQRAARARAGSASCWSSCGRLHGTRLALRAAAVGDALHRGARATAGSRSTPSCTTRSSTASPRCGCCRPR